MSSIPPPALWTFPDIAEGDHIVVSRDTSRSDKTLAVVNKLNTSDNTVHGVDAVTLRGLVLHDLWHADDPRIKNEPLKFKNACSGVFVVATDVKSRHALLARMEALEQRFAALERYVADSEPAEMPAEKSLTETEQGLAVLCGPRRRGRPPKVREPEGVTV